MNPREFSYIRITIMTTADSRAAAQARIQELIAHVQAQPAGDIRNELLNECEALSRAIAAFHMEGIRFRRKAACPCPTRRRKLLPRCGGTSRRPASTPGRISRRCKGEQST
jgi:hypothetical protein